jgi:hypothetical protein
MAYKELYPIVLACHTCGHAWIKFWFNNQSVVHITRTGTSTDDKIMNLGHTLFLITAKFNFCVVLHTSPNKIAGSLSRFNLQELFHLTRKAHTTPVDIPERLLAHLTCNL